MVEYFQNKYSVARNFGDGKDTSDEITQLSLLPGVK